jgi:hypothetical protein
VTYISVPVPAWESVGESPLRTTPLVKPPAPEGAGVGGGASLGTWSINDTPSSTPSQTAWESYRKCPGHIKAKYNKLFLDFCDYMQMCDSSGFSAEGIAVGSQCHAYAKHTVKVVNYISGEIGYPLPPKSYNDFGRRKVSGPLLNRWHPKRRAGWIARMYHLAMWYEANKIEGCTMISMTGYQENSGLSWYDTLDAINDARVKLLKILRKYLGKVSYFWVIEPHTKHNTGYPHIHLVAFRYIDNNIKDGYGEGMEDKLRRLYSEEWGTGSHTYGLDFQQMKGDHDIEDLKNYLMKYISKGYINDQPWTPGELVFNAHLYGATHGSRIPKEGEQPDFKGNYTKKYRIIGMSRDLSALLKPEIEDKEDIVWLRTDEIEPQEIKNDDGTITTEERKKLLYHRELIPDWLDYLGTSRREWGRPTTRYTGYDRVIQIPDRPPPVSGQLTPRQQRKMQQDGYL